MQDGEFSLGSFQLSFLGEFPNGKCLDKKQIISRITVPAHLNVSQNNFVLKMNGHSMQDDGLLHGDLLVIAPSSTANNNQIVIATIDNVETVIKQFEQTNDLIILSCKNPDIKPMIFDPSRIKIVGVLVAQMRQY